MSKLTALLTMLLVTATLVAAFILTPIDLAFANGTPKLQNVYVNTGTGDDSYDGSSPVHTSGSVGPVKYINTGIHLVADDGTVHVAAGTYSENVHLGHDMNLVGDGALTTIIDGKANGAPTVEISSEPFQHNTISGFTIRNGGPSGSGSGGGVYIYQNHIVTINDCAIINNIKGGGSGPVQDMGGGVCNEGGYLYMYRCTVSGNSATDRGGGIYTVDVGGGFTGKMELTNCTISGNTVTSAGSYGAGIYAEDSPVTLVNVTIAGNQATGSSSRGGGFANLSSYGSPQAAVKFTNCIVAGNTAAVTSYNNGYDIFNGDAIQSQGYNIDSENTCYFNRSTDQINTNPLLGPLQNNGGPTSTMAIALDSPAFNRGTSDGAPATDQRGIARPQAGAFDIGAYELIADTRTASVSTDLGTVNFSISAGSISNLINIGQNLMQCSLSGYYFPYGMFSYTISNLTPGQSVSITITLPVSLPTNTSYLKCLNGGLVNCTALTARPNESTIILNLTDGGTGDADGLRNGTIIDPGGPAFAWSYTQPSSSSPYIPVTQAPISLAGISVQSASISATKVTPGNTVTVTATVVNKGNANGTAAINLYINGQQESSQGLTLKSGQTTPVIFTVSRNEPGTYNVSVGGVQAGSFIVDEFADPNVILYISGALVFFALVLGVLYVAGRRK